MEISLKPSSVSPSCPSMPRTLLFQIKRSDVAGKFQSFSSRPRPFVHLRCNLTRKNEKHCFANNIHNKKPQRDDELKIPQSTLVNQFKIRSSSIHDLQICKSNLESLFYYDKSYPEEDIEQPVGLSIDRRLIGNNPPCPACEVKGAVLCATCAGSGLYVDSILESQGIIVKVRCLGCGGTGNIMCSTCGGRGHIGTE